MKTAGTRPPQRRSIDERNVLVDKYRDYCDRMVRLLTAKMGLSPEHYDDYQSAGYLGLIDAADRFDSASPYSFQTYAFYRIRGEIIDYIRRSGHLRGRNYHLAKALAAAESLKEPCLSGYGRERAQHRKGVTQGDASSNELAELLDFASKALLTRKLSLSFDGPNAIDVADERPSPEEFLEKDQEHQQLRQYISELPELERLVLEAYYFRDISFLEVAEEVIGASKSWVSRIHARALRMLEERYQGTERAKQVPPTDSPSGAQSLHSPPGRRRIRRTPPIIERTQTRARAPLDSLISE